VACFGIMGYGEGEERRSRGGAEFKDRLVGV
jgi:hypothetical protein